MLCAIWYHLYNLKIFKNTHGGVLILVKVVFFQGVFQVFKLYKWYEVFNFQKLKSRKLWKICRFTVVNCSYHWFACKWNAVFDYKLHHSISHLVGSPHNPPFHASYSVGHHQNWYIWWLTHLPKPTALQWTNPLIRYIHWHDII